MKTKIIDFKIPEWALCYIFNGTTDNMEDKEIAMVDRFMIDNHIIGTSIKENGDCPAESYFSASNDIGGLACNVYDCQCLCEIK